MMIQAKGLLLLLHVQQTTLSMYTILHGHDAQTSDFP